MLSAAACNLFQNALGHLCEVVGLHGVLTASLCLGTEVCSVAEHLGQRDHSGDLLSTAYRLHGLDLPCASHP